MRGDVGLEEGQGFALPDAETVPATIPEIPQTLVQTLDLEMDEPEIIEVCTQDCQHGLTDDDVVEVCVQDCYQDDWPHDAQDDWPHDAQPRSPYDMDFSTVEPATSALPPAEKVDGMDDDDLQVLLVPQISFGVLSFCVSIIGFQSSGSQVILNLTLVGCP